MGPGAAPLAGEAGYTVRGSVNRDGGIRDCRIPRLVRRSMSTHGPNIWVLSHWIHRALGVTWDQLGESTVGKFSRPSVLLGALPFWFFRLFFLVLLVVGAVSLIVTHLD
jgi:hypothetical protein